MARFILLFCLTGVILIGGVSLPAAQDPPVKNVSPGDSATQEEPEAQSLLSILAADGIGVVLFLMSIAAVALAVEHVMTVRQPVLMPPGLSDEVRRLVSAGELLAAGQRCREHPSLLAFVLAAGLAEVEIGWTAVEKAMEDALADQAARLVRKTDYLTVIANLAPMLGLLGTVIGMIMAFHEVAVTQGAARAADLAQGIYLALVTTVEGLVVAIPALGVHAFLRNRVDQLVAEASYAAAHAMNPLKRRRGPALTPGPIPPPRGGAV